LASVHKEYHLDAPSSAAVSQPGERRVERRCLQRLDERASPGWTAAFEAARLCFLPSQPDVAAQRVPLQPVDLERERRIDRDAYAGRIAEVRTAELLRLSADWRPDVLVRDETDYGAAIAAERAAVPHAAAVARRRADRAAQRSPARLTLAGRV